MSAAHPFFGDGETCELLLEAPGYQPGYCGLARAHPVHSGQCVHCGQDLEGHARGDRIDVCRFCVPHYANSLRGCAFCLEGTMH